MQNDESEDLCQAVAPLRLLPLVVVFAILGCASTATGPGEVHDVVLYVTNQSFHLSPVDIAVYIDGEEVLRQDFPVGDQHHWVRFDLPLGEGQHSIVAVSERADLRMEETFVVKGDGQLTLAFGYTPEGRHTNNPTPPSFYFRVHKGRVGFV